MNKRLADKEQGTHDTTTVKPDDAAPVVKSEASHQPTMSGDIAGYRAVSEKLGYHVLGPLCYGFVRWLVEEARSEGIRSLHFLSRDGWMLKQAFDRLPAELTQGLTSHYLYSSRRAVWFASLKEATGRREFREILSGAASYIPVREFLRRIFVDPREHRADIINAGFDSEYSIVSSAQDRQKLYQLFEAIKPRIVEQAAQEREDYLAYLGSAGMLSETAVGLVDVGWTGSIVKYTQALLKSAGSQAQVSGFFIGVGSKASKKYGFEPGGCLHGYLFDFDDDVHPEIIDCLFVIEKFLSPDEPSMMKMVKSESGFRPIFTTGQPEVSPLNSVVQQSALRFVEDQAKIGMSDKRFDSSLFLPALKEILTNPDPETARLLSQYSYSTDFGYQLGAKPIAPSRDSCTYLRNPLQFFKDYRRARWKAGFIAQQSLPGRLILRLVKFAQLEQIFDRFVVWSRISQ